MLWTGRHLTLLAVPLTCAGMSLGALAAPVLAEPGTSLARAATTRTLSISGEGVGSYPAFDPATTRYAATTTDATAGTLVVEATTDDPDGLVRVDGVVADGPVRVEGLAEGDEVSVVVSDADGETAYSVVYLPPRFPALEVTVPAAEGLADGHVMLTLAQWINPGSSESFEVAIDRNGVPAHVHTEADGASVDLKPLPESYGGGYSVYRQVGQGVVDTEVSLVRLDERFEVVSEHQTVGLEDTDPHEAIWNDDGSYYVMAYEPDGDLVDSVVQHVSADGELLWEWAASDHLDVEAETVTPDDPDWAHLNSIQVMADGDLLLSFRHTSSVVKVAREAHDGFASGDVVWRLGGRAGDFTWIGDLDNTGPCAQHTAYELENGNILIFDNGSATLTGALCVDLLDRTGPVVQRPRTRMLEVSVDELLGTATVVADHRVGDRFAIFAGSAQGLDGGHTMVGWASETRALASELDDSGEVVWEVRDPSRTWFTYRAHLGAVPDATDPVISGPGDLGALRVGTRAAPDVRCTDRGGSGLAGCEGDGLTSSYLLETGVVGPATLALTAVDGAGNQTSRDLDYIVLDSQPDAAVKKKGGSYVGAGVLSSRPVKQRVRAKVAPRRILRFVLRLEHDAGRADRVALGTALDGRDGATRSKAFKVVYRYGGKNVTRAVRRGTFDVRVPRDERRTLRVEVTRTKKASRGDRLALDLSTSQSLGTGGVDAVGVRVRAR